MSARLGTLLTTIALLAGLGFLGLLAWMWWDSRLPSRYDVMDYGVVDLGGGPPVSEPAFSAASRKGGGGRPNVRVTLTAQRAKVSLASGAKADAWTFDGRVPGPEIRVRRGDLLEVTLVNKDIDDGVTIHWHGIDVPNAEDGVAGVTQDAVLPGHTYTYRFRPEQIGTFWYHTHEDASNGVKRGLYGSFVIVPPTGPATLDLPLLAHIFSGRTVLGSSDETERRAVSPGTPVRLRLVNTNSSPVRFRLAGMNASVVAIDGADIAPAPLAGQAIEIGAGGRYDVAFSMPRAVVAAEVVSSKAALVLSPDGKGEPPAARSRPVFDPAARAKAKPPGPAAFDRTFVLKISKRPGFLDGRPGFHWALNGKLYPRVPMFMVGKGDRVRIVLVNDSGNVHPMHLHGHHFLVLTRNGRAVRPWSTDTLNMLPHERYEVAFRADNPGLWMLHCHNLKHAADGLTMHVMYSGVTTPFRAGDAAHNHPE